MGPSISVVIPVRNGGKSFERLTKSLTRTRERLTSSDFQILVIDSGSKDGTPERAEAAGFDVERIPPESFGHGRTRNLGVQLARGEVVCFLTDDVLPVSPDWPLLFAQALSDPSVAGVYGRQVPRDATTMEMFFVSLNYPEEPVRYEPRPDGHHPRPGRVVFSNAFSAVRREVVLRIPIPEDADYSEDQIWARRALAAGYAIAYEPSAEALHAHVYRLGGVFRRSYFVGRALRSAGIDRGAGLGESARFLASELRYFVRQGHVPRLPELLLYEFLRWAGFQVGRLSGPGKGPSTVGWSARP
ncbi:MAG TPA: glycosyltransferase family 2 protein [Longimicrobiales bacterium]|nr:glycosyltransferase family 2 protein [Longimicrobiales bacterium]